MIKTRPMGRPSIFPKTNSSKLCKGKSLKRYKLLAVRKLFAKDKGVGRNKPVFKVSSPAASAPSAVIEHMPRQANDRLLDLLDLANRGLITEAQQNELDKLVEYAERLTLRNAETLHRIQMGKIARNRIIIEF